MFLFGFFSAVILSLDAVFLVALSGRGLGGVCWHGFVGSFLVQGGVLRAIEGSYGSGGFFLILGFPLVALC